MVGVVHTLFRAVGDSNAWCLTGHRRAGTGHGDGPLVERVMGTLHAVAALVVQFRLVTTTSRKD